MTINWDDVNGWGNRVHVAAWAPDPKHADETEEDA